LAVSNIPAAMASVFIVVDMFIVEYDLD